jgi:3-isopropylmalate/(R)-2-methylmalate dehydratase large subunit
MPLAIQEFKKTGRALFDSNKIAVVQDHFVPAKDIATANYSLLVRSFVKDYGISNYFEVGRGGICHHILPDSGLCWPWDLVIGADSHTCTYGAFGTLATGVGSTDLAGVMATGKIWLKIPPIIKVVLTGKKQRFVQGKDIVLHLIALLGVAGASYKILEFTGDGIKELDISDRITISNMVIEAGAKTGIFEVDEVTMAFFKKLDRKRTTEPLQPDKDAEYEQTIAIDISEIEPLVAEPPLPSHVKKVKDLPVIAIDQAFIGSCTNGRLEDMRMAASVLKGRTIHPRVRMLVIPGTQEIFKQMANEGLTQIFIEAGGMVSFPTCGPCLGGHVGVLADNEVCISTSNRNFVGRMGSTSSKVYLSNPAVAAASAIKGHISHPQEVYNDDKKI